ncbi:pyridoxal phosphate-dependent decarboxylase family protein [Lentzea albida]|uniref:L-2,4-diaminobutyrate decarboxylase n=1 Tax=Lentzea albida TaxID=65499 RepID=A0A1H9PRB6_9PSEU|nr:aminotransferase class V-fold PLP-dependent enzyme [Lentzea albida]SER50630.1 L-2,4-diaminobutyrate decarboxylase [Lentzea albida]
MSAHGVQLASGPQGAEQLSALLGVALRGMEAGIRERGGPLPAGGPAVVSAALAAAGGGTGRLPREGIGEERALEEMSRLLGLGSADPAHPHCAAHLVCSSLAVSVAADVVASALNPSMDVWELAPMASEIERDFTTGIAGLCYPAELSPDAVVTSGGTESNLLALLLARTLLGADLQVVCGANAHHSVTRAAWLLGLPTPVVVACEDDRMVPAALEAALERLGSSTLVVATAGTTNTGRIDPLAEIAGACRRFGARLHVDAAYGGLALCSEEWSGHVRGVELADSVTLDMHKFGWQSIAAGLLATRNAADLGALTISADYINASDDVDAGLPDLLGRSIWTSRRADAFRMAVTLMALGTDGVGRLVDHCCATALEVAAEIDRRPDLRLWQSPSLSTVLFRPTVLDELPITAGDALVGRIRRELLARGTAIVGRAALPDAVDGHRKLWLKLTLLHPNASGADYRSLLDQVVAVAAEEQAGLVESR